MSISNLRAAPVMAVLLACTPAPTLAQSLDLGVHYNLRTEFRGAQNAPGPLNGGTNLFVERVTEHVKLKPWAVQLSPNHAPRGTFLHVRRAGASRRSVRLDRCGATRCATRLVLICLGRRLVGAHGPAAHGPDGIKLSATDRNSAASG